MRHSILFVVACLPVLACGAAPPPAAEPTSAPVEAAPATSALQRAADARAAASSSTPEGPPAPPTRCRLTVTDSEGCRPPDIEALVAPVRTKLESCRGTNGGKVRVRVRKANGKLTFDVEPGSSLDPTEKRCVLDALTSIHDENRSSAWSGLDVPPTGFTSLITIEW